MNDKRKNIIFLIQNLKMKNKGKGETIFVNRDIYKMNLKNIKKMGKENIFIKLYFGKTNYFL